MRGGLWPLLLFVSACARLNPAFGEDEESSTRGSGTGGERPSTSSSTVTKGTSRGEGSSEVTGNDPVTSSTSLDSSEVGTDPNATVGSSGAQECEIFVFDVDSDTFVSNAEEGCGGTGCMNWSFTGTPQHLVRTSGELDAVMLLRFDPGRPVGGVVSAELSVHVGSSLSPEVGLFEVHVLDTVSSWIDDGANGPATLGQPTFNAAAHELEEWRDGLGVALSSFDELRDDWPTVPVMDMDDDLVLEIPIQPEDLGTLGQRLSSQAPVIIGLTVLGEVPVMMTAAEGSGIARLQVTACP